jgi:hypothetical protein
LPVLPPCRTAASARGTWGRRGRPRRRYTPGAAPKGGIRRPAPFGRARRSLRPAPPGAVSARFLGLHGLLAASRAHGMEARRRHACGQAAQQ